MAESIFDLIYGTDRFKKPQTGLMSSFDDTDYGDLTAQPEKDYLQGMKTRDKIALLTSPYPVVGGITGTYADAMNMIENPEERTLLNAGLMALNWIPTGRGARESMRMADDSYRVQHQVANPKDYPDESIRLDDLTKSITGEEAGYPADFYTPRGQQIYAPSQRFDDDIYGMANNESYNAILKAKNNPDATVTIYRGVPKGVDKINEGDWVSLSPTYAREHASTGYGRSGDEAGEVISQEVKVKDIYWGGDDVNEFGYFPQKTTKPKESGILENITTKNADKSDDAYQMTYWQNDGKYGDALDNRNLPNDGEIYLGAYGRQTKDFILVDGGKNQSQKAKMRKDDYQDEEIFYTIYDKKTKKPVGTTKLVEQDVDGRRTITGLVDIKINDQNQGIGKKFIDNLKQSAKADPYSVAPEFKVFDVKEDAVGFWEKVGAKDFYERGELGGTYGIKSANAGEYTQDIPKGFKPKKVTKDHKGQINTILEFGDDAVDTSKGLLGNVGSKSVKNLDNFKELKSGDTVTTYHASPSKEIEGGKFDLSKENLHGGTGLPKGVHSAPQIENDFTNLKEFGDNVFELETKVGNLFDYGNPDPKLIKKMQDSVDELFPKASASHKQFLKDKLKNGSFTPSEFNEDFFKHHGIDTIKDGFERIISLNPDNVKVVKKVR